MPDDPNQSVARYLAAYSAVRQRVAGLVATHGCDQAVPACPGWRVHDVISHLAGLCEDWVSGNTDGYASKSWTANQVERFANHSCDEILQAWADAIISFAGVSRSLFGNPPSRLAFGDAVIHEADIRGALKSGRVPTDAVLLGMRGTLARWRDEILSGAHLPSLHVRDSDVGDWWLGPEEDSDAVVLETPIYELFRALAGRRSEQQVREWNWSADPEPFIRAGLPYPFTWAQSALAD